jgi:hypothetical protein
VRERNRSSYPSLFSSSQRGADRSARRWRWPPAVRCAGPTRWWSRVVGEADAAGPGAMRAWARVAGHRQLGGQIVSGSCSTRPAREDLRQSRARSRRAAVAAEDDGAAAGRPGPRPDVPGHAVAFYSPATGPGRLGGIGGRSWTLVATWGRLVGATPALEARRAMSNLPPDGFRTDLALLIGLAAPAYAQTRPTPTSR